MANLFFDFDKEVDIREIETISDLEEKEFDGASLNKAEMEALRLFRELRLKKLRKKLDREDQFHSKYEYFRAVSNLIDYKDFLKKINPSFPI